MLQQSVSPQLFNPAMNESIFHAQRILEETFVSPAWSVPQKPCVLLEVYADSHSPLTEALQNMGYHAIRFTRHDGDLSTVEGRQKLWQVIDKNQPLNIWVAPECGPWGGWSRLNQYKSVKLFDHVQQLRRRELQHVELCSQLCEFQVKRSRHFHLEQPNGSAMPQLSCFAPIHQHTQRARFDMCTFGLRHPISKRFLKKSSQVFSTDPILVNKLTPSKCDNIHEHQTIEGSVSLHGVRMPLTRFCATCCPGFARKVGSWMIKSLEHALVGEHEDSPPHKKLRFSSNPHKRFKFSTSSTDAVAPSAPSMPIDLDPEDSDMPPMVEPYNPDMGPEPSLADAESKEVADVPLQDSPDVPSPNLPPILKPSFPQSERWREVFQMIESLAPRVGNRSIDMSHEVTRLIQRLVPDMQIQAIFVCRGTERFQLPLGLPERDVNNIRHTVCLHRTSGVNHDFGCENWFELRRSQRIRNAMPSKLMISSFGVLQDRLDRSQQVVPSHSEPSKVSIPTVSRGTLS